MNGLVRHSSRSAAAARLTPPDRDSTFESDGRGGRTYAIAVARLPGNGSERMECVGWLIRTVAQIRATPSVSRVESLCYQDTPVTMVRNRLVRDATALGVDYLLSVDSDLAPDLTGPGQKPFWEVAWNFLMARRRAEDRLRDEILDGPIPVRHPDDRFLYRTPVALRDQPQPTPDPTPIGMTAYPPATIAAPYCGPPIDECVYIFRWAGQESDNPNPDFKLELMHREECAVRGGIEEVAALPTGLIIWDLRVFQILPPPWFDYEYEDPPYNSRKASTEDVYVTRNASLLGLPQYCAWDCWAGHVKPKVVRKPQVLTRDVVHQSLADAVRRDWSSRDRLVVLGANAPVGPTRPRGAGPPHGAKATVL